MMKSEKDLHPACPLSLHLLACHVIALLLLCLAVDSGSSQAQTSSLAFAGLRSVASRGQFNAIGADATGNLYLLLDQRDGIHILKTDATAITVLAQAYLGAQGDIGLALALDPLGNIYITGTSTSGTLTATPGSAFPARSGTSTNSFVAKFDSALNPLFLTFAGTGRIAASSIAATATAVFITGSVFAPTLPVTPSAILQAPSTGSVQNGFVEKFNSTGTTLLYATYLTGANGNTAPSALTADSAGNAYIVGYTSASGYPTLAALVPNIIPATIGATSGFLTKLTSVGDGIVFSTFIPGDGLTSVALDSATQNLLISGSVALGRFPVATVTTPLIPTSYQTLLRLPLDGSAILSSTLIAPGTQSFATPAPAGTAWIAGDLIFPLLSVPALSSIGNSFTAHINAQSLVDQTARFGGLPTSKPAFASVPVILTSLITDSAGQPTFAGAATPQASASLLATETYDLPLVRAPTSALPSTVRTTVPAANACDGSICTGSAAYLAQLTNASAPSLALSDDAAPNLTLRNLGSAEATGLTLTSTDLAFLTTCATTLSAGGECSIALTGNGPGTLNLQAANAPTQTIAIPAFIATPAPVVFSPKELDFGIQTSTSSATTRILTLTNLTTQPQSFTSKLNTSSQSLPYTITESTSDCPASGAAFTKLLAPGGTCHITLALTASTLSTNDGFVNALWSIGSRDIILTAYTQAAALSVSAPVIDFGTRYSGGLTLPRYLYLSNSSDGVLSHTAAPVFQSAFNIQDRCPPQLASRSVCQLQIDYAPTHTPSADSATLALDQGLSVVLSGRSLPQPGTSGETANPNLTLSPASISFPNAVIVTGISSGTQTVAVGNTGNAPFALALSLSGDFTDSTNCAATLAAASTCSIVLTFAPGQPGIRQGLLAVTAGSNATPAYVDLSGIGAPILLANNGTLDSGSLVVGQPSVRWYKISQPFSAFSANTSASDFTTILVEDIGYGHGEHATSAFSTSIVGTCINCWLGIQFKPSATGPRSATLTLASGPSGSPYNLTLTGTGLPLLGLILTPASQGFGAVPVHSTSAPTLFTLTNLTSNAAPVTLTAPTITGEFSLITTANGGAPCTGTLPPAASCFLQVAFTPAGAGQRTGILTLATSSGTVTAPLTGFGTADPGLSFNPIALTFHNVPGTLSTHQTITLTNTGSASLQIAAPTVATGNFHPSSDCTTLAPAATCTISVTFTPATSIVADTLNIPVTATIAGNATLTTYHLALAGAYTVEDTGLQILPAEANFGPNPTSTPGLTRQFSINNLTSKALALNVALPRQFVLASPPCAGLAPNATCTFSVAFLPLTNGDITGTLFAQANPTDGGPTLHALGYVEGYGSGVNTLAITGPISPGGLLDFNQVSSGQTASKTLTLTNKGGAHAPTSTTLTVRRITTEWPFLSTSTCGATLALNESCTVTISYTPLNQLATGTTSPTANPDAGTLVVESDALSSPDFIDLAGAAAPILVNAPANTAPLISYIASQSSLTFATTAVGNRSTPQTATLSNTGTATLHIFSFKIDPDFTITSNCSTLVPAASCDLTVYFSPQSAATRIGALEILSDSSSSLDFISLIGAANPSVLTLSPGALNFGPTALGTQATLPLVVTNPGPLPATFNGISATGDFTTTGTCPLPGAILAAASSCTIQVTFTPTQTGIRNGILSLLSTASILPLTAALTGISTQSHLQITPASLNFGGVAIGTSSALSLTLNNTGNAAVSSLALALPAGDFILTTPCPAAVLDAGASCRVTVTFAPSAPGIRTGALTIGSSSPTSPDTFTLTGTGLLNGSFSLAVETGPAASVTVPTGRPAVYNLTLSPINGFTGAVVLNCTPILPADYATCSLLPSTLILGATPLNAVATLNTLTSIKISQASPPNARRNKFGSVILCLLFPGIFLFCRKPHVSRTKSTLWTGLLSVAALGVLVAANGCGSGGDPSLRYSTPGTYRYQVTASSTSGPPITQTVTLNLIVQPR